MNVFRKTFIFRKRAFSIGEVILAMFLLTVGIIAIMNLISRSLGYSLDTRDQVIASELAQEGVELARNIRDNDFAEPETTFDEFDNNEPHCIVDYLNNGNALNCDRNSDSPRNNPSRYYLQYDTGQGFYRHTGTREKFSRSLYVNYQSGANPSATIRSFVWWGREVPPNNGDPSNCTALRSCVYTELYLTSWK